MEKRIYEWSAVRPWDLRRQAMALFIPALKRRRMRMKRKYQAFIEQLSMGRCLRGINTNIWRIRN